MKCERKAQNFIADSIPVFRDNVARELGISRVEIHVVVGVVAHIARVQVRAAGAALRASLEDNVVRNVARLEHLRTPALNAHPYEQLRGKVR